jgi:hypothetical protein
MRRERGFVILDVEEDREGTDAQKTMQVKLLDCERGCWIKD